jgi:hypothetical protein
MYEQLDDKTVRSLSRSAGKTARILGWALGLGFAVPGFTGCVWLLLHWGAFMFGYHYVGLTLWSYVLLLSLLCIYIGSVILWSVIKRA